MIFPFLIWLSIITATATTQTPSCASFIDIQLEDSSLEFAKYKVEQYQNGFSIIFSDSIYITDFYFTKSEEAHKESVKNNYHAKPTCQIDHEDYFVSKIRIINQSI